MKPGVWSLLIKGGRMGVTGVMVLLATQVFMEGGKDDKEEKRGNRRQ